MKKSTGIVFLVAVALAAVAYFYDWKRHPFEENPDNGVKMPFSIQSGDVTQITLTRAGMTIVFDHKDDGWYISKPLATRADQSMVNNVTHYIAIVPEDRTVPAEAERQDSYGLTNPAQILEFKLQNGTTHKLRMGAMDFSGLEVYAQIDDSKDIVLLSNVLFNSCDKSLDEFRDHAVLNFTPDEVASFDLHNQSGDISAERSGLGWNFVKPLPAPGASNAIASLLEAARSTQITSFVSNDPKEQTQATLAKYGLSNPAIRFRAVLVGGKPLELLLGNKEGAEQYAMDVAASSIFRVRGGLYGRLNQTFMDLRAKVLYSGQEAFLARIEIRNQYGTTNCVKDPKSGGMVIEQAPGQKDPAPACPDVLNPLQHTQAKRITDQPPAEVKAKLDKPAVQITLIEQSGSSSESNQPGKKMEIAISTVSGESVYGRTSAGPTVYEFDGKAFDALNFKPSATTK